MLLKGWFKKGVKSPSLIEKQIKKIVKKIDRNQMKSTLSIITSIAKYGSLIMAFIKAIQAIKEELENEVAKEESKAIESK